MYIIQYRVSRNIGQLSNVSNHKDCVPGTKTIAPQIHILIIDPLHYKILPNCLPHFPMYSWLRTLLSQGYSGHMHTWDTRFFRDLWAWQYIENMRLSRAFSHDIEHISTAQLHDRERRKGTYNIRFSEVSNITEINPPSIEWRIFF